MTRYHWQGLFIFALLLWSIIFPEIIVGIFFRFIEILVVVKEELGEIANLF